MAKILELLGLLPRSVQVALAGILIGGAAFAGHEVRYMTVADFTKSYVLDLKRAIRELQKDIAEETNPQRRADLREDLELLLDDLCYELPNDRLCQ